MSGRIKVYCVDDESSIRDLYSCAFESANINCECFEGGEDLFCRLSSVIPDIILLDVMLDGMDGFGILEKLKNSGAYGSVPVIMVSAKGEEVSKVKGLNLGADDYIAKPFGVMELVARVKANVRKTKKREQPQILVGDIFMDFSLHEVSIAEKKVSFTLKEYNLLKLLCSSYQSVVSREDILQKVWGTDFFGETRTVDMHIKELRKKLANASSACEIETVRGVGYILK